MAKKNTDFHAMKYVCEICDYTSKNRSDYNLHCLTMKHKKLENAKNANKKTENTENINFQCVCGKIYKHQSSLCSIRRNVNMRR